MIQESGVGWKQPTHFSVYIETKPREPQIFPCKCCYSVVKVPKRILSPAFPPQVGCITVVSGTRFLAAAVRSRIFPGTKSCAYRSLFIA